MRMLTYLSICSVGLTLAAFVTVLSVMNGFDRDLQDRIVSSIGAIRGFPLRGVGRPAVYTPRMEKSILETPGVLSATPEARVSAILRGVPSDIVCEAEITVVSIASKIKTSPLDQQLLGVSRMPAAGEILLASALAEKLSIVPGDSLWAILILESANFPATFRVSGTYRTGYYEMDERSAILPIETLRALVGVHGVPVHSVEIAVSRRDEVQAVTASLTDSLLKDGMYFRSWRDMREPLFRAVNLEKRVMALILSLFGIVSVFSVFSALTATAVEKRRELATLRAMGMTRGGVAAVLIFAGFICAGLGTMLGSALSVSGHLLITRSDFFRLPSDIYDLDRLPSAWSTELFASAAGVLFVLSLAAAAIPAIVQAGKAPSAALRDE